MFMIMHLQCSNSMEAQNRAEKYPGRQHFVQKNHVSEPVRQCFTVLAEDAKHVNAFGAVIDYDPSHLEFVSAVGTKAVGAMENLTVNKVYSDGTAYVNLAFANRGDQPLYSGSDELAVITMKARTDLCPAEEMNVDKLLLIGPAYDVAGENDTDEKRILKGRKNQKKNKEKSKIEENLSKRNQRMTIALQ